MATSLFICAVPVEAKVLQHSFKTRKAATDWAKGRVADEAVASVAIWRYSAAEGPYECLMAAATGKPWWDERELLVVVTKPKVRVSK